jgi:hypothetical protein
MAHASRRLPPRAVIVTRPTELELLLLRHGTRAQARFFVESRGQRLDDVVRQHELQHDAVHVVSQAIPVQWRKTAVTRADLDRFLFEPEDVIVAVGQDGLVANVAKYLTGQPVLGVNPSTQLSDGVLARHAPASAKVVLKEVPEGRPTEARTMVQATTSDGQRLLALNEIFVGHRSHQSARYRIACGPREERHSSSGVIVCTGTGATGWARSIARHRQGCPSLPEPASTDLLFLVREPWPSVRTGTDVVDGRLGPGQSLAITSEMNDGGVAFGDGIEADRLELPYGQVLRIGAAPVPLRLVT